MIVDTDKLLTSFRIAPGDQLYTVAVQFDHPSLKVGDVVKMVEHKSYNIFLRPSDLTLHRLEDNENYVLVVPVTGDVLGSTQPRTGCREIRVTTMDGCMTYYLPVGRIQATQLGNNGGTIILLIEGHLTVREDPETVASMIMDARSIKLQGENR